MWRGRGGLSSGVGNEERVEYGEKSCGQEGQKWC